MNTDELDMLEPPEGCRLCGGLGPNECDCGETDAFAAWVAMVEQTHGIGTGDDDGSPRRSEGKGKAHCDPGERDPLQDLPGNR